jgi:hypothetical protein
MRMIPPPFGGGDPVITFMVFSNTGKETVDAQVANEMKISGGIKKAYTRICGNPDTALPVFNGEYSLSGPKIYGCKATFAASERNPLELR